MRKYVLVFIIVLLSQPIGASNENVINQLNNAYDVSRLEFSLFKIKTELVEELRDNYEIKSFNNLYAKAGPANYEIDTLVIDQHIIIYIKLNEFLNCYDKKLRVTEAEVGYLQRKKTDRVATELMQFFGHFGDYQRENVFRENIVDLQVAKKFLFRPEDERWLNEEQQELTSKMSELIKFYISVEYCPKNESAKATFLRIYKLTSDYDSYAVDGNIFENVEERNF